MGYVAGFVVPAPPKKLAACRIHKKVMADPRQAAIMDPGSLPYDGQRMLFGGFKILVDL